MEYLLLQRHAMSILAYIKSLVLWLELRIFELGPFCGKALGNNLSNLAHTYFFIIFTKIVHVWAIVIVSPKIWVKGHPVTFREVKIEISTKRPVRGNLSVHISHKTLHLCSEIIIMTCNLVFELLLLCLQVTAAAETWIIPLIMSFGQFRNTYRPKNFQVLPRKSKSWFFLIIFAPPCSLLQVTAAAEVLIRLLRGF